MITCRIAPAPSARANAAVIGIGKAPEPKPEHRWQARETSESGKDR
jgi:hypothetical protein